MRVANASKDEPRSQLVAACRRTETKLCEFCQEFGGGRSYTSSVSAVPEDREPAILGEEGRATNLVIQQVYRNADASGA